MAGRGCKTVISDEDMAKAEECAFQGCQTGTICTLMGWDRQWVDGRPDILTKLKKKRAERKLAIRTAQMGNIKNPVMGIWLGKNELNQTDKAEFKHGVDEVTTSLLDMIDGHSKNKLPSEE